MLPRFTAAQFTCGIVAVTSPVTYVRQNYVSFTNKTGFTLNTTDGRTWNDQTGSSQVEIYSTTLTTSQTIS